MQGLPVPLVGAMVDTAAIFLSYSYFQNLIRTYTYPHHSSRSTDPPPPLSIKQLALAASAAGFAHSFIMYVSSYTSSLHPLLLQDMGLNKSLTLFQNPHRTCQMQNAGSDDERHSLITTSPTNTVASKGPCSRDTTHCYYHY